MSEPADHRLKRLSMRSWRRGTKEMDMILGPFSDERLATMADDDVVLYDQLLAENDQDLYQWVSGQAAPPERFAAMIDVIAAHARSK